MATAYPLGLLFGGQISPKANAASGTTANLPAGYIVEHGAQYTQPFQQAHQALVNQATTHAAANPVIQVHLPARFFQ